MEFIDYYKMLELTKTAAEAEIKKAYRRLARKYHPDLSPDDKNAEKKFKEINEANEVLSNAENRKKYDKYGKDWKHANEFEKSGYNTNQEQPFGNRQESSDFSNFFASMYGNNGNRRNGQAKFRGQDLNAELQLTLNDVCKTQKQTLTVNNKSIRINIPAGVENGQVIKISGHGAPGVNGGPDGDLLITFSIVDNSDFKRDGNNLHTE